MFIKICGITNEPDALLACALGADALGFVFAASSRQVSVDEVSHFIKRLPAHVLTVGVFANDIPERVVRITNKLGIKAVQLHGNETIDSCLWIAERVPLVIKGFCAGATSLDHYEDYRADYILLDSPSPGSGKVFDWAVADGIKDHNKLILSGGLNYENVQAGIKEVKPFGVDTSSGVERAPGFKDPIKLRKFIKLARAAFEDLNSRSSTTSHSDSDKIYDWQEDSKAY